MTSLSPGAETILVAPEYELSNHIAENKARRLPAGLSDYASEENWHRINERLGVAPELHPKKKWRAILKLPNKRNDILGMWFDKKEQPMKWPDEKKTELMTILLLAAGEPKTPEEPEKGLYLAYMVYDRAHVLKPSRPDNQIGRVNVLLRVTFHVLVRLIQRGRLLSDDGEISYIRLLKLLGEIQNLAEEEYDQRTTFPAEFKVTFMGFTFVVAAVADTATMTLVTVYPSNN